MKNDEAELLQACQKRVPPNGTEMPREVAASLGMHPKRAAYIFQKWTDRGWYNYGVSVGTGWMEPEGLAVAEK
jgi:hypothetical protein